MILGKNIGRVFNEGVEIQQVYSHGNLVWERQGDEIDYSVIPFTMRAVEDNTTIQIISRDGYNQENAVEFKYSINNTEWIQADSTLIINLNRSDIISIMATDINLCVIKGLGDVYGNIMSLMYGDNFIGKDIWVSHDTAGFFKNCDIRNARNLILPATTLKAACYASMFKNCSKLKTAPQLPATTLVERCYYAMFDGCSSLRTAPQLPATKLAEYCYGLMFSGCSSLKSAPQLPATKLAKYCYYGMFMECSSLISAPELPAPALASGCYIMMFRDCSSLSYIKCYGYYAAPPGTSVSYPYDYEYVMNWTVGVSLTGKFVCINNSFVKSYLIDEIPSTWTIEYIYI